MTEQPYFMVKVTRCGECPHLDLDDYGDGSWCSEATWNDRFSVREQNRYNITPSCPMWAQRCNLNRRRTDMKQPEMELCTDDGQPFVVRYDADRGEEQWFDARAGVGGPGYPPSVCITEVKFGDAWELPEVYPQVNWEAYEEEIMSKLIERDREDEAERVEALARDLKIRED